MGESLQFTAWLKRQSALIDHLESLNPVTAPKKQVSVLCDILYE